MSTWALVSNYGRVLVCIKQHGRISAREIAGELGITERSVMRIIAGLEAEGYLERRREGRSNCYTVNAHLPLRRPEHGVVGELLDALLRHDPSGQEALEMAGAPEP
ncbi:MAG: MarR family transcriptional regulator [Chloroflexi bacterium]|nr:MarR family transcriptional regulator [Chloroflexota bacterium]